MEIIFTAFFEIIVAAAAPAMAAALALLITGIGILLAPFSILAELTIQILTNSGRAATKVKTPATGAKEALPTTGAKEADATAQEAASIRSGEDAGPAVESVGSDTVKPAIDHPPSPSLTGKPGGDRIHWQWTRRVAKISAVVLTVTVVILAAMQWMFLPTVVRWTLSRAEKKSGVSIEFENVSGNLFSGRLDLADVSIQRENHPLSDFDLQAPTLTINLDMNRVIRRKLRFDLIEADSVRGSYTRKGKKSPDAPRKKFEVALLRVRDARVEIRDQTHPDLPAAMLEIVAGEIQPLRGDRAVSDVLLHSQLEGRINGQAVTATSDSDKTSGVATWTLRKASVNAITTIVGPLSWIDQGAASAQLSSHWSDSDSVIPVHCEFQFHDVAAHVPDDAAIQTKLVASPVLKWINNRAKDFDLSFDVRVPRDAIAGQVWLANSALMAEIGNGLKEELFSAATNLSTDNLKDSLKQQAMDAAKDAAKKAGKSFLDRLKND